MSAVRFDYCLVASSDKATEKGREGWRCIDTHHVLPDYSAEQAGYIVFVMERDADAPGRCCVGGPANHTPDCPMWLAEQKYPGPAPV